MSGTATNADGSVFASDVAPSAASLAATQGANFALGATPPAVPVPAAVPGTKFYTEEDLARVREQEKGKLYPQIEAQSEQLKTLLKERDDRLAAEKLVADQVELDKVTKEKNDMTLKQRIEKTEADFEARFQGERNARLAAEALMVKEREYSDLKSYRSERVQAEADNIMPELIDLIAGNTKEELDQSITVLKERTARIIEAVQQSQQTQRRESPGTRVTVPGAGPLDINTGDNMFTPADIAAMDMETYKKHRGKLIGNSNSSGGMFG